MALVYRSGPAVEPVTVAEAKAHLRLDTTAEDALITSLILTSRLHIEAALGLALITQGWTLVLDAWPRRGAVELPMRPVQTVRAVRVRAADGTPIGSMPRELSPRGRRSAAASGSGDWVLLPQPGRAAGGIEIDFTAGSGSGDADVPEPIRQALKLLVAHWYEHRDPIEIGEPERRSRRPVSALVKPYRWPRL